MSGGSMLKQHGKKIAGFGVLSAVMPFLIGADVDPAALVADDASFWLLVLKLLAGVLGPAVTMVAGVVVVAVGAALIAYGKAKLADKDPSNDALGAAFVAAGRRLAPTVTDADSVLTPPDGSRPLLPASSLSTSPAQSPPSKNGT